MDFQTAIRTCLNKYSTFTGRAGRPEFWWFVLFVFLGTAALRTVDGMIFGFHKGAGQPLAFLFALALLLPYIAAGVRRLHDTGKSGLWLLLALIPVIGTLALIWLLTRPAEPGTNPFGPPV